MNYRKSFRIEHVRKAASQKVLVRTVKKHPYVYITRRPNHDNITLDVHYYYQSSFWGRIQHLWNWQKWKKLYAKYENGYYKVWLSGDDIFFYLFGRDLQ